MTDAIVAGLEHSQVGGEGIRCPLPGLADRLLHVLQVEVREEELEQESIDFGLPLEDLLAEAVDLQGQSHNVLAGGMRGALLESAADMLLDDGQFLGYFVHRLTAKSLWLRDITDLPHAHINIPRRPATLCLNNRTFCWNIHNLNYMQAAPSVTPNSSPAGETEALRRENSELSVKLQASEQQRFIAEKKIEVLEAELAKTAKENHGLVLTIEAERKERLALIQTTEDLRNGQNLHDAEAHKFQSLSRTLGEENEWLKGQLESLKLEKVSLVKEKQNASNKLLLAETKLEALAMQEAFYSGSIASLTAEKQQLKEETETLARKLRENSGGYVKTILKDNNQTTRQLLTEFEEKIHSKEMANMEEKQRYEDKIAQLTLRLAQLESQIASR